MQNVNISLLPHVSFSGWAFWPRALFGTVLLQLHDSSCSGVCVGVWGVFIGFPILRICLSEFLELINKTFLFVLKRTCKSEPDSIPSILLRP